ncbi:hypothetical protein EST38_g10797 [Candolleomyces aberdarensis]|uniref:MYND-type domain-containing protein n=1 Tax=Candolleomyces aberdarensis TaxID=2316362 RepID=A0A4V1Q2H0_9AGAR|nr:hypothetical protein EST38_g10797 [Candolleomyces aberdarensis]
MPPHRSRRKPRAPMLPTNYLRFIDESDPFFVQIVELISPEMTVDFDRNIPKLVNLLNSNPEQACGVVEHAVKFFDRSLVSGIPFDLNDPNMKDAVERVFTGLVLLSRIFRCFKLRQSDMRALEDMCLPHIVERWTDVIGWIVELIAGAGQALNGHQIFGLCAETLESIIQNANENPSKQELISLPAAAHAVCLLLCQIPKSIEGYFYIVGPADECIIIELLSSFLSTETGHQSFTLALKSYDKKMKRRVIMSLTERPGQFVSSPAGEQDSEMMLSVAKSLLHLLQGVAPVLQDEDILHCFLRHNFIGVSAYALDSLAKKRVFAPYDVEFWNFLSNATISFFQDIVLKRAKSPHPAFAQAVQEGLLRCAERCLLQVKSEELQESLLCRVIAEACNYFTFHDGLFARGRCYSHDLMANVFAKYPHDRYPMITSYTHCIVESGDAFKEGTDRFVSICSNLNHSQGPLNVNTNEGNDSKIKLCSRCRMVQYCSTQCQKEDWHSLHSKECRTLACLYRGV